MLVDIDWTDIANRLITEYGPVAALIIFVIIMLLFAAVYQEKRRVKTTAENREDWEKIHARHREDRNQWIGDIKEVQQTCVSRIELVTKDSTKTIKANTAALTALIVHIENCNRR